MHHLPRIATAHGLLLALGCSWACATQDGAADAGVASSVAGADGGFTSDGAGPATGPGGAQGDAGGRTGAGEDRAVGAGGEAADDVPDAGEHTDARTDGDADARTDGDADADAPDAGERAGGAPDRAACKRGVAYGFDPDSAPEDVVALSAGVSWFYGWAPAPSSAVAAAHVDAGVEFVPMVWGGSFDVDDVVAKIPEGARYLLGFNEPNFHAQANLTPEQAAALWPQLEEIATRRNLTLVSPAVNFCGGGCNVTDPFEWLDRFFAACSDCRVDHVAAHWYACDRPALEWYIGELERYERPIWLTEFSCGDKGEQPVSVQRDYMRDALDYLEGNPSVFRYAWFSARTTAIANVNLLSGAGALTELGNDYTSLPAPEPCLVERE